MGTEGRDKGFIYQFKQKDGRKGLQDIPKSKEAMIEANGDFFE